MRLREWLYEDGIGESRAALVEDGRIIAAQSAADDDGAQPGAVVRARLLSTDDGVTLVQLPGDNGEQALLSSLPHSISIGAETLVEITRSAIPERDLIKRAKCRPAADGAAPRLAPSLLQRISASGDAVRTLHPHQPDMLESAGWSELCDAAMSGQMAFAGGMLRMALTPAMTVIDIDGVVPPAALAHAGARAAAQMITAMGIGGNIVIDLPTMANKAERVAAAEVFDEGLPQPFERTAINGFGLLQIIRPRLRPSLAERWQFNRTEQSVLALLRRAERHAARVAGTALSISANPAEIAWLMTRPALIELMTRRSGRTVRLHDDQSCAIGCGYVG